MLLRHFQDFLDDFFDCFHIGLGVDFFETVASNSSNLEKFFLGKVLVVLAKELLVRSISTFAPALLDRI